MQQSRLLSAIAAAAAFFASGDAALTASNGNIYDVGASGATIAAAIPAAYAAGSRPARASEWPLIKNQGAGTVTAGLGSGTAVLWDDSNGNFATVDFSNLDAAPVPVAATDNNPGLLVCACTSALGFCLSVPLLMCTSSIA